jgi:hypothetical protein
MQCSIPPLQPNKRIGTVIPFHLHLFLGIVIPFPNEIDIPRTKRGLSFGETLYQDWFISLSSLF